MNRSQIDSYGQDQSIIEGVLVAKGFEGKYIACENKAYTHREDRFKKLLELDKLKYNEPEKNDKCTS